MKWIRIAIVISLVAGVAAWLAFRFGIVSRTPALVAVPAILVAGLSLVEAVASSAAALKGPRRSIHVARVAMGAGLFLTCVGGLANWAFSLQGMVILNEKDTVPLGATSQLQAFEAGPLSNVDEMQMTLRLEKVDLIPGGSGTFSPISRLRATFDGVPGKVVEVAPGRPARLRTLRLQQGAFGYSPRIVILKGEKTLFDDSVPFLTERHASTGVTFWGTFSLQKEDLAVEGFVNLESLDQQMRGHPSLGLEIRKAGEVIGRGDLLPGHFAEVEQDYRIGFAGLSMWSEIDITRRNYPGPVLSGLGLLAIGLLVWPVAAWRNR